MKVSKKISAAAVATPTTTTEKIQEYEFPFLMIPFTIFAFFHITNLVLYILESK